MEGLKRRLERPGHELSDFDKIIFKLNELITMTANNTDKLNDITSRLERIEQRLGIPFYPPEPPFPDIEPKFPFDLRPRHHPSPQDL
ncbi:unnamed protein product [Brachionus calyciflorus]|uniref:Uncharacterized protein n=1 Tax=Brachionus calyciflorus TaxID=104777 RepID=A0A813Y1M5_9BILA|nr:unnamed protein product [Brachionus calyciflorus]